MHLKKVEFFGFKSFADKTEISFEKGVTCVVGPNGCGKSNISDAIRWVLGERSAKLLRGSKMEDVIFAGTDFRKPLNIAEVSLTIDNIDQSLPIQYEEVVITRRLHRSGESEYLLNKTLCRLKDIQDLILDTGIGSNSYSMIEQGRIDYILNAEADERRFLIEEAAGISKFKVKKEEALRKLERTEENLVRLNDIISEVERNIRYAERQAQRAERYKDQLEHLKKFELKKAFFEIKAVEQEISILESGAQGHQSQLSTLDENASRQTLETSEIEKKLRELEYLFLEQENARSEVRQELTSLTDREQFHRERIEFLKLAAEKALGEIESLTKRAHVLAGEIDVKRREHSSLDQVIENFALAKADKENLLKSKEFETGEDNGGLGKLQTTLFELSRTLAEAHNSLNALNAELKSFEKLNGSLQEAKLKLLETQSQLAIRKEQLLQDSADQKNKSQETRQAFLSVLRKKEELDQLIAKARDKAAACETEKTQLESGLRLLEELDHAMGPDPKKIVAEHGAQDSEHGVMQALLDLVEIESGYELALEAALQDSLRAVVTENLESAVKLLGQLKQSGSHTATIFIKNRAFINGSLGKDPEIESHPFVSKRLWDALRVKAGYEGIFANLLGKVYLVEEVTTENAAQLSKFAERVKFVSKSGAILGPHYQLSLRNGGYTAERSVLARKSEMGKLTEKIDYVTNRKNASHQLLEQYERELAAAKKLELELSDQSSFAQVGAERIDMTLSALEERFQQIREEIEVTDREEKQNSIDLEQGKNEACLLSQKIDALEQQKNTIETDLGHLQSFLSSQRTGKEQIERNLLEVSSNLVMNLDKRKTLDETIHLFEEQYSDIRSRIQALETERQDAFNKIEHLTDELANVHMKKETVTQLLLDRSVHVERVKQDRNELLQVREAKTAKVRSVSEEIAAVKQALHEHSLKMMQLTHQKDSIQHDLQSRYRIDLSQLNSEDYVIKAQDFEELKAEISKLAEKLEAGGPVNLLAIDEFQELKGRYDFLANQKRDLTEARDSLLEAIRKINRETKKLFEETFTKAREAFKEYFRNLFGGGHADLILLDELNPLDSGLDIIARPPGKKMQHISLLSGGEKAMTAIALLLSLFSIKPSPFCVLDEVDAPLDEANNERFVKILKPFLAHSQFIIVTHSRKTISMGDALYGVTMQEPGVSKIVSVRLRKEEGAIEHSDKKISSELNQVLN